jgi:hypothetical protein
MPMDDAELEERIMMVLGRHGVPSMGPLPRASRWPSAKRVLGTVVTVVLVPAIFAVGSILLSMHDDVVALKVKLDFVEEKIDIAQQLREINKKLGGSP